MPDRAPLVRVAAIAATAAALALIAAEPAAAQLRPRVQAAWVNEHVAGFVVGLATRQPIGVVMPPPEGQPRFGISSGTWWVTGMAGLGVNFDPPPDHDTRWLIQAHGGFMRLLQEGRTAGLGLVAVLYMPAGVAGPAARFELRDLFAVQAGWMFDAGLHFAVDADVGRLLELVPSAQLRR